MTSFISIDIMVCCRNQISVYSNILFLSFEHLNMQYVDSTKLWKLILNHETTDGNLFSTCSHGNTEIHLKKLSLAYRNIEELLTNEVWKWQKYGNLGKSIKLKV